MVGFRVVGGDVSDAPEAYEAHTARIVSAMPDVLTERVMAVGIVVVGTLLNGWGTPLARRWGLTV